MTQFEHKKEVPTGLLGESIACKYLCERGYALVERNYRKPWGEIDIVAKRGETTHFVEVKTVSCESNAGDDGIDPSDNIHAVKMRKFLLAAHSYVGEMALGDAPWQIDAVLIVLDRTKRVARVNLLECIGI